jgi:4,5-dihydroxyphthalate decarboxylase
MVVTEALARSRPDVVAELYELLKASKARAGEPAVPDLLPFGIEANRKPLELIVEYAFQQKLIPRRYAVDELFHDATRNMN